MEALVMTLAAGVVGMMLSAAITSAIGTLPFLGPAYEDDSGKVDIHLTLSLITMMLSTAYPHRRRRDQRLAPGHASRQTRPCRSAALRVTQHDRHCATTRSSSRKVKPEEAFEGFFLFRSAIARCSASTPTWPGRL